MYSLSGLSFREYLSFEGMNVTRLTLTDVLYNHAEAAERIIAEADVMKLFKRYFRHGYYPFYITESEQDYILY